MATGVDSTALGGAAMATGVEAVAVGERASATALNAMAVGTDAMATADNSSAFGNGATAAFANSMAIGPGVTTSRANQVVLGSSNNTYTLPGLTSSKSKNAQVGATSLVTTDAFGNLATDGGKTRRLIDRNTEGIAMAMALDMPAIPAGKRFAISPAVGYFEGESAVTLGARMQINDWLSVEGGGGYGVDYGTYGGRVGFTISW